MSAGEQYQISMVVAAARKSAATPTHIGIGTSVHGKSIGLTVDSKTPDFTLEIPVTVNGQPNSKVMGSKQSSSTADNKQHRTATAVRQKVYQLKVGNDQAKVFGDTLKPDTIVVINRVRSRFKDLSADRQKQIRAAWSQHHLLPRL